MGVKQVRKRSNKLSIPTSHTSSSSMPLPSSQAYNFTAKKVTLFVLSVMVFGVIALLAISSIMWSSFSSSAAVVSPQLHTIQVLNEFPHDPQAFTQARILALNASYFLKSGGHFVISIKANCIDSTVPAEAVFESEVKKMTQEPSEQVTLEPFERDHACVIGGYRMPKKQKGAA